MYKDITIVFHNEGLRSYIEVDLCRACPRQDDKGCCGFYSPVFYASDLVYLLGHRPELLDYIFSIENITVLDASVTVNKIIDGDGYRCHFHCKDGGCMLDQDLRESVCRHFVCPGIDWERESKLLPWKDFFAQLSDYEIALNNRMAALLQEKGLTLRNEEKRGQFWHELQALFELETAVVPDFFSQLPERETVSLTRVISYARDWPL